MSRHHRDCIIRDLPRACHTRLVLYDAVAQLRGHDLALVGRHLECLSEVCMRQMQSHAVAAEHPDPQRLVMTSTEGAGQVVACRLTRLALIPLSRRLGGVSTLVGDVGNAAAGTAHTI
jgi:hypothetical protein